jgi:hypothetical protein
MLIDMRSLKTKMVANRKVIIFASVLLLSLAAIAQTLSPQMGPQPAQSGEQGAQQPQPPQQMPPMQSMQQGQPGQPSPEAMQLQQEYMQINQKLQMIQQQAIQDDAIATQTKAFAQKIDEQMIAENPEMKSAVAQRDVLVAQYENAQQTQDQQKLQELQQGLMGLMQQMNPVMEKVMQSPAIQKEEAVIREKIITKMKEINPETDALIKRIEQIALQMQQIQG